MHGPSSHRIPLRELILALTPALAACAELREPTRASLGDGEVLAVTEAPPASEQARLDWLVGEFEVASELRPWAEAPPLTAVGTMTGAWSTDGSSVVCVYRGDLFGVFPELRARVAFDATRACFVGSWSDREGRTVLPLGDGFPDPEHSILFLHRRDGTTVREVLHLLSPEEHAREILRVGADGEWYPSFVLHARRR